ncbi:thioredoxin family protein [Oenococcus sp. UCMA 16435]|nr:thioredoxin family protein [Oenococcus sp. UCMA 16435]
MNFYEPETNTDDQLEKDIEAKGRNLMFLSADWCGDCKAIKPFVQNIKDQVSKTANWFDADRDVNLEVAKAQGLRGIPSFVLFQDGKQVSHIGDGERLTPKQVLDWYQTTL